MKKTRIDVGKEREKRNHLLICEEIKSKKEISDPYINKEEEILFK
jgi:hypothetical protein